MAKSLSAQKALSIKRRTIQLEGEWGDCFGEIACTGVVFFWGQSGNGKSSAVMSFAKELTKYGKVIYLSLEEGLSLSFQNTLRRYSMQDCGARFQVVTSETMEELSKRLLKRKSPEFIIIDSFQYTQMSYRSYIEFRNKHSDKLLIFVSHADGKQPAGRAARSVKYDAMLKVWVEGYRAFSNGRFIGSTGRCDIWAEQAQKYWCNKIRSNDEN